MSFVVPPTIKGGIPYNGMLVRNNNMGTNQGEESPFKVVFGDEARKINPLHDVNTNRNDLILQSIEKNDWSDYHRFQAKQHPAWYELVNGEYKQNKIYYGNLIESKISALKEARAENDQEAVARWQKSIDEAIQDFNQAPGVVPYVVGLNHREDIAKENGVAMAGDGFFDSKWNSPQVASQGKFEQKMWYDNAYFAENQEAKKHVESLVAGKFPTSTDPDVTTAPAIANEEEIVETASEKKESIVQSVNENTEKVEDETVSIQSLYMQNLKYAIKPSLKLVQELYS